MRPTRIATAVAVAFLAAAAVAAEPLPAERACQLRLAGQSDEAREVLEQALEVNDTDAPSWFELARTEFYHLRFAEAAAAIERAIELSPQEARYHHFAGVTAAYNAVLLAKDPATRGAVQAEMGRALRAFAAAVEADPAFHEARLQLINMLVQTPASQGGDRNAARRHIEELGAFDAVAAARAEGAFGDDESDEAEVKRWRAVVEAHPQSAEAHAGMARAYLHDSNLESAAAEVDAAIALDAKQDVLLFALCREFASTGDVSRAKETARRYLDLEGRPTPLRAFATFYLAALERQHGDRAQAEALLAEAKRLDPHCWTTFMEPPAVLFEKL